MHILGGACVHIKVIGSTPIPHQSQTTSEGIGGHYPLSMLGRTLLYVVNSLENQNGRGKTCRYCLKVRSLILSMDCASKLDWAPS